MTPRAATDVVFQNKNQNTTIEVSPLLRHPFVWLYYRWMLICGKTNIFEVAKWGHSVG